MTTLIARTRLRYHSSASVILYSFLLATSNSFASPFQPTHRSTSLTTHRGAPITPRFQMSTDNPSIQIPHLESETLHDLVEYAISFSAANGLQVQAPPSDGAKKTYITAPISLLPQSYPSHLFQRGVELARPLNDLVDRISRDGVFLKETLRDVRTVDEYTGKLLDFYEEIYLGALNYFFF